MTPRTPGALGLLLLLVLFFVPCSLLAQEAPSPESTRIAARIQTLQREATRLAGESRTLLGDLRKREIERDLKVAQMRQAEVETTAAEQDLQRTTDRLSELELKRINELPDMKSQLVDIYKRGHTGYLRILFGASDLREFARAVRAVGALSAITEQRISDHRRTLEQLRLERDTFAQKARELQASESKARRAKANADAAVASVSKLIGEIDSRRDLNAQYVGELQVAYDRIQQQLASLSSSDGPAPAPPVPLRPFQGALEWPVQGRITGPFGQPTIRLGGSVAKNGIEISAEEDTPVRAVHGGVVGYAGPFAGFGTLVILDHGSNNYSLYGYLESTALEQGQTVGAGAEVGRVGPAPAGPPTLYFEMRIDGRSVNPVQWLKPR